MKVVRLGIIGMGSMGAVHARNILDGKIERIQLAAVCDRQPEKLPPFAPARPFTDAAKLLCSDAVDAVLIATPHFDHTAVGIAALNAGLHVLLEKPISVHKADALRLLAAHKNPQQVFAVMFNQRTDPRYRQLRQLIRTGELGAIRRINWTITDWFRTQAYYGAGSWRATWAGEGGGVLLNQSPHQLDLWSWLFGQPTQVRAFCQFGRFHKIEVEDSVTAYLEHAHGAQGVFITTTGEAPGANRLEIAAERGKIIIEGLNLKWTRTDVPVSEWCATHPKGFEAPPTTHRDFTFENTGGQHVEILQNFVDAILDGTPLIAPAAEGIHSVELANAMLHSTFINDTVTLPLDATAYAAALQKKIALSSYQPIQS
ncbi:MAG TPA: Gfo/Idh/MocA family oxidoreductase [Opitutales bacterium]|nr:Gfo/Idh/MocA family oxidoreductase [Opitutales bacterium]